MAYYARRRGRGVHRIRGDHRGTMIAPWGGLDRRVGLNPISWAAPTGMGFSYNLDMAPSVVAGSKVQMAQARGEQIPLDWALDAEGQPTDDPEKAFKEGTLAPIGGPKGVGLGIAPRSCAPCSPAGVSARNSGSAGAGRSCRRWTSSTSSPCPSSPPAWIAWWST